MSMTIEQAIIHAEEVADRCAVTDGNRQCEDEHRQLAAWLRELQERRKEPKIIRCGECEHSKVWGCELYCIKWVRYTSHKGYCHRGSERRT